MTTTRSERIARVLKKWAGYETSRRPTVSTRIIERVFTNENDRQHAEAVAARLGIKFVE